MFFFTETKVFRIISILNNSNFNTNNINFNNNNEKTYNFNINFNKYNIEDNAILLLLMFYLWQLKISVEHGNISSMIASIRNINIPRL